jgi:hypothetical protein
MATFVNVVDMKVDPDPIRRLSSFSKDEIGGSPWMARQECLLVNSDFPYWVCPRQYGFDLIGEILDIPEDRVVGAH